jgi:hypothetical protein
MPSQTPTTVMAPTTVPYKAPTVTAQEILFGRTPEATMMGPSSLKQYLGNEADAMPGFTRTLNPDMTSEANQFLYSKEVPGKALTMPTADIFSKPVLGEDGIPTGRFETSFLPTAVSQAASILHWIFHEYWRNSIIGHGNGRRRQWPRWSKRRHD